MREKWQFKNERADCAANASSHLVMRQHQIFRSAVAAMALVALLCGTGVAYGQNQKNKKKGKDADVPVSTSSLLPDSQAIDLLVSQMLGAWQAGDAEAMHKFYADDTTVISGAWEPPLFGWANYARAYQAQFARTSGCRLERTNSYIKVLGDTGLVTYQWQFVGDVDGKRAQAFGHTTLVLQKQAGNWLIVLNHTSTVPTDEPVSAAPAPATSQPVSSLGPTAN
jgi:uncharacterized protein (TIGR02246 family)